MYRTSTNFREPSAIGRTHYIYIYRNVSKEMCQTPVCLKRGAKAVISCYLFRALMKKKKMRCTQLLSYEVRLVEKVNIVFSYSTVRNKYTEELELAQCLY